MITFDRQAGPLQNFNRSYVMVIGRSVSFSDLARPRGAPQNPHGGGGGGGEKFLSFFFLLNFFFKNDPGVLKRMQTKKIRRGGDFGVFGGPHRGSRGVRKRYTSSYDHDM